MSCKIFGGITGACVGDALGVPVESCAREEVARNPVTDMRASTAIDDELAGTWSDDSSLMLCLADSIAEHAGIDPRDIMDRFIAWLNDGRYSVAGPGFGCGGVTYNALTNYLNGVPPFQCGPSGERDNGNGSLMRIMPLTFYLYAKYGADLTKHPAAMDCIHKVSALTHGHPFSKIACGIYVTTAARLIDEPPLAQGVREGLARAEAYYSADPEFKSYLVPFQRLFGHHFSSLPENAIKSSGYVVDTLEAALWSLLGSDDFRSCALKAVNLGGDADTVGAVACGLAGLYYGYAAIPPEWLASLRKLDFIKDVCRKLALTVLDKCLQ